MSSPGKLIILPPSHFCERARWALQHMKVPFTEERWAVGPHVPQAKKIATGTTLPIFVTDQNKVIQGSGAILDLTGMEGADPTVEERMELGLGILARSLIYSATLHDPKAGIRTLLFDGVPRTQAIIGRAMWPMTRRLMAKRMDVGPGRLPEIKRQIEAELTWIESRLGERRYMIGDSFGRADLTVASLMSPLLGLGGQQRPTKIKLPGDLVQSLESWGRRPALRYARRIYAEHRHPA